MPHSKKLGLLAIVSFAMMTIACGDSSSAGEGAVADSTAALSFHGEAAPLADFKYDTGLLPEGSPAQLQLKLSAGGRCP